MSSKVASPEQEEIICDCSGTTRGKILQLIARGDDNLDRIESVTGANTGCGSCESDIIKILENPAES